MEKIDSDAEKIRKEQLIERKKTDVMASIKSDRHHLEIINLCRTPFIGDGEMIKSFNLIFICHDPLSSNGDKNFDILIYSAKLKYGILVECKSTVSNPSKELSDIIEKINIAHKNKQELAQLCGDEIKYLDFVICTTDSEKEKFVLPYRDLAKSNSLSTSIIMWSVDSINRRIRRDKRFSEHSHEEFNKVISAGNGIDCEGVKTVDFTSSSNMCIILKEVYIKLLILSEDGKFTAAAVTKIIKNALINTPDQRISDLTNKVIKAGIAIGVFIQESQDSFGTTLKNFSSVEDKYVIYHARALAQKIFEQEAEEELNRKQAKLV
ncbi:MAG: hypothetical protein M1348_01370 [Candidatus Parvarchaeota archaeon]|nr:hypothetical protein [Candidatus Parvarchaeota archaeon]